MAITLPMPAEHSAQKDIEADAQGLLDATVVTANASAVPQPSDEEVIAMLAALTPMEYDRVRTGHAKALGVQIKTLDALVKAERNDDDEAALPFPIVEPYPDPIVPAQLLDEIAVTIHRFIVVEPEQADAAALWVTFTWFIGVVQIAPLAIINAPEKACGKSQMLDVLGRMVARPLPAANSSTAFLFRAVEKWTPTLLIDEADTFIRENAEIKGLINAGYTRANAYVGRVAGDDHDPKLFAVWGAKALAGIALEKHLPDATMSRAIVFELRRKLPHESISRLRHAEAALFEGIASKLARFADDYSQQVQRAQPDLPDELGDRAQDNWEPLLAIAECAGPFWVQRATAAALKISSVSKEPTSTGNELLADIQEVFERKRAEKICTADLIEALVDDDEKPWATYNRGKPLTPRQLARQLNGYGIKSKTVRLGPYQTPKGFDAAQFKDAFARYLTTPISLPQQSNDTPESNDGMAGCVAEKTQHSSHDAAGIVADNAQQDSIRNVPATGTAMPILDGGGVEDKASVSGGSDSTPPETNPLDTFADSFFFAEAAPKDSARNVSAPLLITSLDQEFD